MATHEIVFAQNLLGYSPPVAGALSDPERMTECMDVGESPWTQRDQLVWNGQNSPEQSAMARSRRWPMLHRERWA